MPWFYDSASGRASLEKETAQLIVKQTPDSRVIHKPAAGCPVGWTLARAAFTEEGSRRKDGCYRIGTANETEIDYLQPSEKFTMRQEFPKPPTVNPGVVN